MAQVTKEVLDHIRADEKIIFNISQGMKRSFRTVERWIKENTEDGPLTTYNVLQLIKTETGFPEEKIMQRETASV